MEQLASGDPHRIGAYRLLARLGAGGMGQVYLARSDRGRTVAVKLVRRELAEQEEFRSRFRQEVAAARRVGGTWTAPVLDADTEAEVPWVATGYIAGPSLHAVVSGGPGPGHGPLPERSVRALAAGLARALRDIHSAGIVHRDLKPSNVLVTIDGPRVIDFGIARALETVTDGGLTRTGALVGSPGFMAPEQVRGERITPACDVFCLGSVLAYAASGRLPFGSADSGVHALMFRIAEEQPDLSDVPDGLRELIQDCLHKDPAERPALGQILARANAAEGSTVPWLPGSLIAQLGSHAVKLLEVEHPENFPDPTAAHGTPGGTGGRGAHGAPGFPGPRAPGFPGPRAPGFPGSPGPGPAGGGQGVPGTPGTPGVHALPTRPGAPTPPHGSVPPHTPVQPYGAVHPHGPASTPPPPWVSPPGNQAGYTIPYGPPAPEPPSRGIRGTVALVAVAVVVAVAAGTSVYALMNDTGHTKSPAATGSSGSPASGAPDPSTPSAGGGGRPASSPPPSGAGAVPEKYVGTWRASFTTSDGNTNTRVMTIAQGPSGATVMTLTGQGATYDCRWSATLQASGPPLELGPTQVTFGDRRSCSPGQWSRLEMPDDRTIVRELVGSGGAPLTYTKVG